MYVCWGDVLDFIFFFLVEIGVVGNNWDNFNEKSKIFLFEIQRKCLALGVHAVTNSFCYRSEPLYDILVMVIPLISF